MTNPYFAEFLERERALRMLAEARSDHSTDFAAPVKSLAASHRKPRNDSQGDSWIGFMATTLAAIVGFTFFSTDTGSIVSSIIAGAFFLSLFSGR